MIKKLLNKLSNKMVIIFNLHQKDLKMINQLLNWLFKIINLIMKIKKT